MADVQKEIGGILFEWDENKAAGNIKKHGVSFETAARIFQDDDIIEIFDSYHSDDEMRMLAIGMVDDILSVVYTERHENTIRIISARPAVKKERRMYYEQFGQA